MLASAAAPRGAVAADDPAPVRISGIDHTWRFAFVRRPAIARSAPSPDASRVARLTTRTPERTGNLVPTLARQTVAGRQWVKIRPALLPNGTTAWVPRSALSGYQVVRTHLYVNRATRRLRLERRGRTVLHARIGVGRPRSPTPPGRFIVRNKLRGFESPAYGPLAFGTSARSAVLTDWPGGGFIGIHGTDRPAVLPGAVSHGCIRLRNRDIRRLARHMPVGTPITIR